MRRGAKDDSNGSSTHLEDDGCSVELAASDDEGGDLEDNDVGDDDEEESYHHHDEDDALLGQQGGHAQQTRERNVVGKESSRAVSGNLVLLV